MQGIEYRLKLHSRVRIEASSSSQHYISISFMSGDTVQATHLPPHICRGQLQDWVLSVCLYKEGTEGMRSKLCLWPGVVQGLGGATSAIMCDLLAFEADRRAVNITINRYASVSRHAAIDDDIIWCLCHHWHKVTKFVFAYVTALYTYSHSCFTLIQRCEVLRQMQKRVLWTVAGLLSTVQSCSFEIGWPWMTNLLLSVIGKQV